MHAIVSGRSGRALIIDGDLLRSFELDDPSEIVFRGQSDLPYLFGEAADLRVIENTTIESIADELKTDCSFTLALDLTLISLDADLPIDIRREGLEGLEELLADRATLEQVENVLYAEPLPEDADLKGALDLGDGESSRVALEFLRRLGGHQLSISGVTQAWEAIPTRSFDSHEKRELFKRTAVKEGLFRNLAMTDDPAASVSRFQLKAGLNQSIQCLPNHRQVLLEWTAPFQRSRETLSLLKENLLIK